MNRLSPATAQTSPSPLNGERAGVRGGNVDRLTYLPQARDPAHWVRSSEPPSRRWVSRSSAGVIAAGSQKSKLHRCRRRFNASMHPCRTAAARVCFASPSLAFLRGSFPSLPSSLTSLPAAKILANPNAGKNRLILELAWWLSQPTLQVACCVDGSLGINSGFIMAVEDEVFWNGRSTRKHLKSFSSGAPNAVG